MSEQKRQQLIADGKLREDGSRIERCPTCGHELSAEQAEAIKGGAVANGEPVNASATTPEPEV